VALSFFGLSAGRPGAEGGAVRYQVGDLPVPGYRLEGFLGAGSYGEVWKAVGPGGVPCALKFISMDSKSGLKEFRSIRLVKKLQHPNLCPVQAIWLRDPDGNVLSDTGEDSISIRLMGPKELVIAMGLGQKSLAQRLEECRAKGGIPPRELLRYVTDAAKGIDYLNNPDHDLGEGPAAIIHCDIKPANLLIVGGGVQVCDYGVAKALAPDSKKTFAAGTPAYAPAELINNEPTAQTDQYSLAITYYELRTGRLPFDEAKAITANLMGLLDLSGVGPDEQAVIRQATHKQPVKRFESCEEFVEALKVAANVTLGPSGVISASQIKRAVASPPPEAAPAAPRARPAPPPEPPPPAPAAARKSLSDLLQPGGEVVPDHFLNKLLGRGGYGEVWEARASGGVRCALKVVRDLQGKGKHEFAVLDKIRELDHPNLVQLRGYWLLAPDGNRIPSHKVGLPGVPDPSSVIISTDLAEKNLLDRLKECKQDGLPGIPAEELVGHVRQAAVALDYLNIRHHIQHRDVKPENLLLRGDRLLVSDFGLAKLVEGDDGVVSSSSSGMTLEYAAPELLQKRVSSRTDQYSLALTYYTLRTGRMPFPSGMGQFDTMQARIKGHLDLSGVADPEQAVLRKALSPNPSDRFASCEELARELAVATGIGSGQLPALPSSSGTLRAPDQFRSTLSGPIPSPAKRTPRDAPDPAALAAPEAPTKSGLPFDTPRASSRPGEVPLTPAAASAGTIMFGHGPDADPGSPGPAAAAAPWAEEGPRVKATKSGPAAPKWNEGGPAEGRGGGGGRTVAVVAGVAVLLASAAVGGYLVINRGGTGTVASSQSGVPTQSTDKGGGGQAAFDTAAYVADVEKSIAAKRYAEARGKLAELRKHDKGKADELSARIDLAEMNDRVNALANEVEDHLSRKEWAAAERKIGELRKFDKDRADKLAARLPVEPPPPPPDVRLAAARKHFKAGKLADGLTVLDDILKTSQDDAARQAAGLLRTEWARARAASEGPGAGYPSVAEYRKLFPPPVAANLPDKADFDDLTAFRKHDLATKIKAAVPGLDAKTDWAGLAAACGEADPTDWVAACLTECWAELTLVKKKPDFRAPAVAEADADGYGRYATTVRRLAADLAKDSKLAGTAADDAADLVDAELTGGHGWATAFRFGRLAGLLTDARLPLRARDDDPEANFARPYRPRDADRVCRWLLAARKAAGKAGAEIAELDYELTLAEGCKTDPDPKEFPRTAEAAAAGEYLKKQGPLARARFWVFHARAQSDQKAGLSSLGKAFDLVQAPGAAREAQYAYKEVVRKLRDDLAQEPGKDRDKARPEADLLADVAQKLADNEQAWAKWKVPENKSPAQEAVDLLVAAHQAKVKAGKDERDKALEYARRAVRLADKKKDVPDGTRAEAYAALGWYQFDEGFSAGAGGARGQAWDEARGPLEKALELAPQDARAWRWQFAVGVTTRVDWEAKAAAAKARGVELKAAEKLELANDLVRAANLVRTAEYQAFNAFNSTDPAEKAAAKAFYAERDANYRGCKEVLDAAAKNKDLANAPELPLWKLTAAEMEFAIPAKPYMTAEQKKQATKLADEAEKSLDKIKDTPVREAAKLIIKRVREYKTE
jgi:serine/threonine protein kinase